MLRPASDLIASISTRLSGATCLCQSNHTCQASGMYSATCTSTIPVRAHSRWNHSADVIHERSGVHPQRWRRRTPLETAMNANRSAMGSLFLGCPNPFLHYDRFAACCRSQGSKGRPPKLRPRTLELAKYWNRLCHSPYPRFAFQASTPYSELAIRSATKNMHHRRPYLQKIPQDIYWK